MLLFFGIREVRRGNLEVRMRFVGIFIYLCVDVRRWARVPLKKYKILKYMTKI